MSESFYPTARPYTRWWWFSGAIRPDDIVYQLDWVRENGFGGVEIAWVYPLPEAEPGPRWLSSEWSEMVAYASAYAHRLGLGCDFTFGTLWPFGGSIVSPEDASWTFAGLSSQRLRNSWEQPHSEPGYILNHLDRHALERYAQRMGAALAPALAGRPAALFCDSWEVEPEGLWTPGFDEAFIHRFGYDVRPYMAHLDQYMHVRYDYRRLLSHYVLEEFYRPYTAICHRLGGFSRVQCHGAPTDILAAYAAVDVPESEAILFDPPFSQIAASAAALAGKEIVSAEAFTCLYGWKPYPGPAPYGKREQIGDLKLLADGLFANGVNLMIWHGMPYNPPGGRNEFYASVHVGPDSAFAADIPGFNRYMERVSAAMRRGRSYSDVAVYLPLEDNWMRDVLPEELRRPSARYYWELPYQRMPGELAGYRPLWVSASFLEEAEYGDGQLRCGKATFSSLYLDVDWLDSQALRDVLRLARQGLPVCLKRQPVQPGWIKEEGYCRDLARLLRLDNVRSDFAAVAVNPPLVEGADIPEYWCRVGDEGATLFFAHPLSRGLRYPMCYGQSFSPKELVLPVVLNLYGRRIELPLRFAPYQSLLVHVDWDGAACFEDITWSPQESMPLSAWGMGGRGVPTGK